MFVYRLMSHVADVNTRSSISKFHFHNVFHCLQCMYCVRLLYVLFVSFCLCVMTSSETVLMMMMMMMMMMNVEVYLVQSDQSYKQR